MEARQLEEDEFVAEVKKNPDVMTKIFGLCHHEYKSDTTINSLFITPRLRKILSGLEENNFTKLSDEEILDYIDKYRKNNNFTVDDACYCFPILVFEEMKLSKSFYNVVASWITSRSKGLKTTKCFLLSTSLKLNIF